MRISDWSSDVCSSDLLELASPEHFFALPQAARLAVLRSLVTDPRAVAELVTYVLDQPLSERVVSENELSDLLLDYLRNSEFRRNYELSGAHGGQWYTEEPLKRSEEHTSELQSLMRTSYADFCMKKNKHTN